MKHKRGQGLEADLGPLEGFKTGAVGVSLCKGWNAHKAAGFVVAALDRLAEHYGMV